jgi:probable rRNA maturation factor
VAWTLSTAVSHTLDFGVIQRKLEHALAKSERPDADIALRFVSHDESRTLNVHYRKKDAPGNVLSFPVQDVPEGEHLLGDVFIAYPILRTGFADKLSDEDIAVSLAVHGFLHLLGFDHQDDASSEEMDRLHESLVS